MSFLVGGIKFGQCCFHNRFSCYADIALPDSTIKKYINSIVTAYSSNYNCDNEFLSIIQIREISNLLENRLNIENNIKALEELGKADAEMKQLGHDEYIAYQDNLNKLDEELLDVILNNIGKDDCRDIVIEITAGVGGNEAMIFTGDLLNMYRKHFEYLGFNHELIEISTESGIGGIRNASVLVSGNRAFELLRHEGGVHRVQRIPATEKFGRMHTSTVSVVVLPQPNEIEVNLLDKDLRIETKRSSGAGGQSVNTTDSAVRITHLPTGISVDSQSERSQSRNKQIAFIRLRAKIYDKQLNEQRTITGSMRKKQRGMSSRNEKIRTYNYSQDRITDHRLTNGTLHNLKGFMEGGECLENLQERLQKLYQLKLIREAIEKYK
ncbi:hypothetical protein PV327_000680 [Microctonus hyperodae]|uniref:Prokaryotic-type class I peptide chain release factors domain-containing protein n=1 Tax=Microctonus hyperodae TaxID=165561 RepID=A0AA39G6N5_MICHY|nr:hypothetical protein PV327_000680 [Microctonus hyperodae]